LVCRCTVLGSYFLLINLEFLFSYSNLFTTVFCSCCSFWQFYLALQYFFFIILCCTLWYAVLRFCLWTHFFFLLGGPCTISNATHLCSLPWSSENLSGWRRFFFMEAGMENVYGKNAVSET
jgi:hypothetical protein